MTDHAPVSDTPITVSETTVEPTKRSEVKSMEIQQQYIPRLDGTDDPYARADRRLARLVAEVLVKHFYGYTWLVVSEIRQGVVYFSIPDLMGDTLRWVIRLPEFPEMMEMVVMRGGGELLERMGLRRGPMDRAEYESAKQNRHLFDFREVKS